MLRALHWRLCLYILNALFGLSAVTIIAVSIVSLTGSVAMIAFLPKWVVPISIGSGAFFLVIVILGCCGAKAAKDKIKKEEINWWLVIYAVIIFILLAVQIAALVAVTNYSKLGSKSHSALLSQIEALPKSQWQDVQNSLSCCGFTNNTGTLATGSMCNTITPAAPCKDTVISKVEGGSVTFLAVFAVNLLFGFLALLSSTCLACCIESSQSSYL